MISQDVKNELLLAIDSLVARIMLKSGIKENDVDAIIAAMFANEVEAVDETITNKIVSPLAANLAAIKVLNANIGTAPDAYNTIEKIGLYLPQLLTSINEALAELAANIGSDVGTVGQELENLKDFLAKHGVTKALNLRVNDAITDAILSIELADLQALELGPYVGLTKASKIGLTLLVGECGGVPYDEDVMLRIEHSKFSGIWYQTRTAVTSKGLFVAHWNSTMLTPQSLMWGWQRPAKDQLQRFPSDTTVDMDDEAQYEFIRQLELGGVKEDLSGPYLDWLGSYEVSKEWMTGRQLANDLIFWVTTQAGGPPRWFIIADAVHSSGYSGDGREEWEARGARIVDTGVWIDFGAAGTDPSKILWQVEVCSGQGKFYIHDTPHGEPLGARPTFYNGDGVNSDFSVSVIAPYTDTVPSVHVGELVIRVNCTDTVTGKSHSRLLRLKTSLDNRITQMPVLDTTIGTATVNPNLVKTGSNDLVTTNAKMQFAARTMVDYGRNSPFSGVFPEVNRLDGGKKSFYVSGGKVCTVSLGVSVVPDMTNPGLTFSDQFVVGVELTYGGVSRQFEFIDDVSLSERVGGVLTGQAFEDVAYLVNEDGVQWFSFVCGKTETATISMLETLFPTANTYVAAMDDKGGNTWFAHTGTLEIKLTATPKDPADEDSYLELVTSVELNS